MTATSGKRDFEAMRQDPGRMFGHPREVLELAELTYEQKLEILQAWQAQIGNGRPAKVASDPPPALSSRLEEVNRAVEELQAQVATDRDQPEGAPTREAPRPRW